MKNMLIEIADFMKANNINSFEELISLGKEELNSNLSDKTKFERDFINRLDDLVDEASKNIGFDLVKKITYLYFCKLNENDFEKPEKTSHQNVA